MTAPPRETEIQALPDEPPPPPPPPPPPEAPELEKVATPLPMPNDPPAAAPPPAAAANVKTAPDDAPVDLTSGMVVGSAETYAGGGRRDMDASSGWLFGGRRGIERGDRLRGATASEGTRPLAPAQVGRGQSWNCPFPAETDEKGIDNAVVELSIEVTADGEVANVRGERDPGTGFGRVAASCARSKRFSPAEDRDGKHVHGRSRINVRFQR
jgi:periplasmic protein TonB